MKLEERWKIAEMDCNRNKKKHLHNLKNNLFVFVLGTVFPHVTACSHSYLYHFSTKTRVKCSAKGFRFLWDSFIVGVA